MKKFWTHKILGCVSCLWLGGVLMADQAPRTGTPPRLELPEATTLPPRPGKHGLTVDALDRAAVAEFFKTTHRASDNVPAGWNGNRATCFTGTNSTAYNEATLLRINYFRAMAGLPGDITLDATKNSKCMDAALMFSVNGDLDHFPPPTWTCYKATGAEAAGKANIFLGIEGPYAVDGFIDDEGDFNYFLGHRRWLFYPPARNMGTGSVPGNGFPPNWAANAIWVIGDFGPRPPLPTHVAWPPRGYIPYQVLPTSSGRWSFSYPNANFANATVTMRKGAQLLTVRVEEQLNNQGYADNTLVWVPTGVSYTRPTADTTYSVGISNVVILGVSQSFNYDVTVIDPDAVVTPTTISLKARRSGSNIILTWPTTPAGYRVEMADALLPSTPWTGSGLVPTASGGTNTVNVPNARTSQYFRLTKP